MKTYTIQKLLKLTILLLVSFQISSAQTYWENDYLVNGENDISRDILSTSDGGYILSSQNENGAIFTKLSFNGMVQWENTAVDYGNGANGAQYWGNVYYEMIEIQTGGYAFTYTGQGTDTLIVGKLSPGGNVEWLSFIDNNAVNSLDQFEIFETADSGFIVYGNSYEDSTTELDSKLFRLDALGNLIWEQAYPLAGNQRYGRMILDEDGSIIFAHSTEGTYLIDVYKTDANGTVLWNHQAQYGGNIVRGLRKDAHDRYIVVSLGGHVNRFLEDGTQLPAIDPGTITLTQFFDIRENGNYVYFFDHFLAVTDTSGTELWRRDVDIPISGGQVRDVTQTINNGFALSGSDGEQNTGNPWFVYATSLDSLGGRNQNIIEGHVIADYNENCSIDGSDIYIPNAVVAISQNGTTTYTTADQNGYFKQYVYQGTFEIELVNNIPNAAFSSCTPTIQTIIFTGIDSTVVMDIYLVNENDCPGLSVDITSGILRSCVSTANTIHYCNDGMLAANNVEVVLSLDPSASLLNSTVPPTSSQGNSYTFDIGTLAPFECGMINFSTFVDCDSTAIGQVLCNEVSINPDTICDPDTTWSGASLRAEATCLGTDTVELSLRNIGTGDMDGPTSVVVIEDIIMIMNQNISLDVNELVSWKIPVTGTNYRITSQQPAGHPLSTFTTDAISHCDLFPPYPTIVSDPFFMAYPLEEESPFVAVDCQPISGAYDPNDKSVVPAGVGVEHYITAQDEMEYKIRFQNTGNDTAFKVVLTDSIASQLDITTFKPGAASHPYTYSVSGTNLITFTFDNILLPDSNVDEPGSNGYVQYKIKQQAGNAAGVIINNNADIFFDFNPPIRTNTTFNEIGSIVLDTVIYVPDTTSNDTTIIDNISELLKVNVRVYPNPVADYVLFEHDGELGSIVELMIYDQQGKTVVHRFTNTASFIRLNRSELPSGVYYFDMNIAAQRVSSGKLVFK